MYLALAYIPLTLFCISKGLAGHGKAQSPLPLNHGDMYYSTIRAITGAGDVLEAITDGFTVDLTPPSVAISEFAGADSSNYSLVCL